MMFGSWFWRMEVLNFGSSICKKAGMVLVQQLQRRHQNRLTTTGVTTHGETVIHECSSSQSGSPPASSRLKLAGNWQRCAQLVGIRERIDAPLEHVHVFLSHLSFVRKLLE